MPPKKSAVAAAAPAKPRADPMRPFVSVLTPTYNRRMFLKISIACFKAQTYPQDRIEWIILDDGSDPVEDVFKASGLTNVKYHRLTEKLPIGAKRNMINELATGDICVAWDDDDYYPPDRIRHAVTKLLGNRRTPVVGSSEVYLYFSDRNEIWSAGPYNPNHCTNGTMAYWRTYFKDHKYDPTAEKAEERLFMDDWKTPVTQIRPEECMLVICHAFNTFDKRRLLEQNNPRLKKISMKMRGLVHDAWIRDFYTKALPAYYKELDAKAATVGVSGEKPPVNDAEVFGAAEFVTGSAPTHLSASSVMESPAQMEEAPPEPLPSLLVSELPLNPALPDTTPQVPPSPTPPPTD
jgi:glycosyltransferase involved in cell wall biosynthesis